MVSWFRLANVLLFFLVASQVAYSAPPAEAYAALPKLADLEISPDGHFIAARMELDNQYHVVVMKETDGRFEINYVLNENDEFSAKWFYWANDNTLLISFGFIKERWSGFETNERRLFSLTMDDKALFPLFHQRRGERALQIQDRVVSFLPDDPEHILVQYNRDDPREPDVYLITVNERSRHKRIVSGKPTVRRWITDNDDVVRIGAGIDGNGDRTLFFRLHGEDDWQNFSHWVEDGDKEFRAVGFAADPNIAYVISNHETDPAGLYTFDIQTEQFLKKIYNNPSVEIASVRINEDTGELIYLNFVDDEVETVWFDKREINKTINALAAQMKDKWITTYGVSQNGNHAILRAKGGDDAGQFLVLDALGRRVTPMPRQYPGLDESSLARTIPIDYEARDGLTIPAFITLPPGMTTLAEAKSLPFVINPHGGPTARDFLRFSFDVQFLASRGYGVLQMNFRGSSGYGNAFEEAGDKQWGQAMQDDIADGVSWLVAQGFADPDRIAISGGSYGGYAALMGVAKTPDLYQCAISFAGVSDLPDLIERQKSFIDGRHSTRFIGGLWRDRKMLAENSPAQRADDIVVPVLLMHGDSDTVVNIHQSELMAKRLRRRDKIHELIIFEGGDHHLSRHDHRLKYLQETERFLAQCLGGGFAQD